jgi:hypothetical protein
MKTATTFALVSSAALCISALASCSKESGENLKDGPAVSFTAAIDGARSATRTTNGGDNWIVGDGVGIYMLTAPDGVIPTNVIGTASNVLYTVDNITSGKLLPGASATPIDYPASGNVEFIAYYPHDAAGTKMNTATGKYTVTLTDQTTPANIDVLRAKTLVPIDATTVAPVSLSFYHMLSKFTINIKAGTGVLPADVAAIAAGGVKLSWTPGSATIDLNDGSAVGGANADIVFLKEATAAAGYDATFTAIIAPHTGKAGRRLDVTIGARTVRWSVPQADAYTKGNNYLYSGTIDDTGLVIETTSIVPWIPVTQPDEMTKDGRNDRITWDAAAGQYTLTTDPADAGLFFKFGSVVGIYTAAGAVQTLPTSANGAAFDAATDVAWDPTGTVAGTADAGWATVPVYNGTDFDLSPNTITPSLYHNKENVKAGKGDPCRLVGLDLAKIKDTAVEELTDADIDNGVWRLPTPIENQSFSGYQTNISTTGHRTTHDGTAIGSATGVVGAMFPNATTGSLATFLPAVGGRHGSTGTLSGQGTDGAFWSSIPANAATGGSLYFGTNNVNPVSITDYSAGFTVRCVRQ